MFHNSTIITGQRDNHNKMKVLVCVVLFLVACVYAAPRSGIIGFPKGRVAGGQNAEPHAYPWQVSLQKVYPDGYAFRHSCGGTIVNEKYVLTAAHCIVSDNEEEEGYLQVVVGKHNLLVEEASQQIFQVKRLIPNEEYDPDEFLYDTGLIEINGTFKWTPQVQPISLPIADTIPSGEAIVTGWGSTSLISQPQFPPILQMAVLPIIDYETCFKATSPGSPVHRSTVCTGPLTGGKSVCSGDSGGPLIQIENNKAVLIGVVNWAYIPCGRYNSPSGYAGVSHFIDWIKNNTAV